MEEVDVPPIVGNSWSGVERKGRHEPAPSAVGETQQKRTSQVEGTEGIGMRP